MDSLIYSLAFTALAALLFLIAAIADRRITFAFALLGAVYMGLDDLVTGLPRTLHILSLSDHWNWTGKILSLLLSAIVILALRISPRAVGLKKPINWKVCLIALVFLVVWGACLGLLFKPGQADAETLAFQATMPELAEELVCRGIVPALLFGLILKRSPDYGIPWAVILATSFAFGIWHGLQYSKGSFGFDVMSALFPFIGSIPGDWLRFKTDSIVIPILAHGIANVAFQVAGGLAS